MNQKAPRISNTQLATAYTNCGEANGYMVAEMILMKYCPPSKPDGKCFDVAQRKRAAFLADLQKATTNGVKITKTGMVINEGG